MVGAPLFAGAVAAAADDGRLLVDVPGDGEGFVHDTSTPLLHFLKLAPGSSTSGEVTVKNDSPHVVELALQAVDVREAENGCNRPEAREDTTCDDPDGELGDWLVVTVSGRQGTTPQLLWSGDLDELSEAEVLVERMPAGAEWALELNVELPFAAGNDTQTDRTSFDLRWIATADSGESSEADILGVEAFAPGAGGGLGSSGQAIGLPFTGATADAWLVGLAAALLAAGAGLLAGARRRVGSPAY
jgi:hypothetical protein